MISSTEKQTDNNLIEKSEDRIEMSEGFEDEEVAEEEVDHLDQSDHGPDHEPEEDSQSEDGHPGANIADSDDTDAVRDPQANAKEWFLPNLEDTFETYIDHGCILDGYPIYPNGKTIFVRKPGETVTNFGTVGFSKTSSSNKRGINNDWKVVRYFCLGALVCDDPSCQWAGPPPTGKGGKQKLEEGKTRCPGKSGKCKGNVTHKKCCRNSVAVRFDYHLPTGWGLLRHKGTHPHPWPEAKKPDPMSKDELKAEILKNLSAGALKLKTGKRTDPAAGANSVTEIHPAYINKDRLAYYRRKMLVELNLVPDKLGGGIGDKFVLDMFAWAARGLLITSASFLPQNEHFTFQTQWMADRLLARDENNQVYSGGLISDVTYRYFETGYLLSTSMYCEDLHRWIPIQLTWIRGLSEEYYKLHFTTLFRQFQAAPVTPAERDTLVRQVVDFSSAQAEGFVSAYLEVFRQGTRKEGRRMLKGCREHFRQSVTRIKRNRALMTADEEEPFQKACMDLLEHQEAGGKTHEEKVDFIRRRYPKVRKWLDWWTVSDIEALLFPSRQPRLEDTPDGLPDTTNAQESMHRIYYRLSDGKQCIMVGMVDLFSFVKMLEEDWKAAMKGIPISYGANPTTDIGTTLGIAKKRKRGEGKFINDGRPPDTTDELVDGKKKKKAKLGRPPNSTNFNKSLWSAYPSYHANKDNPTRRNRCWLAAGLESLYALFSPLWLRGISGHGKDVFTAIAHHFSFRSTGELNGSNAIRSTLTRGQNMVFDVLSPKYPGRFVPGAFASCDYFLEVALDPQLHKKDEYKQLFSIDEHRTFTCELQPNKLQKHPTRDHRTLHVLTIKPQMFDENRIPHSDVSKLIEMWQTDGLLATSGMICKHCNPNKPKPKLPKNAKIQKVSSDVDIVKLLGPSENTSHHIIDRSRLAVPANGAPLHLNFYVDVTGITDEKQKNNFMGSIDWPFKINVGGATYTLISRGYWQHNHYWCKVLRSANISADKGSLTAIWLHNDAENDGYAQQINRVPSSIAGVEENTSWLLYSRDWTPSEEEYVNNAIQKIVAENPEAAGDVPFKEMKSILNTSHSSTLIPHTTTNEVKSTPPTTVTSQAREKSPSTTMGNAPKNYTSPVKGTTPIAQLASQMNAQIARKYALDQKEPDTKQQCSLDAEVTLEIDESFLSVGDKSHGDQSFVLGDQSLGESHGDQSFVLGDQSLESHGDQSCGEDGNKDGGDQTFSLGDHTGEDGGDQTFSLGDHTRKDGGDQSFALGEQSLGNQTGNQSLADETDDHVTQTQVKHSQEDEEVPQKPPIRFKVILRPPEQRSPPSTKGKTQASRRSVRKKK
ncbi:uncharacterized protein PGTG_08030 [Puccinia graminis f. sp. tritici CRL 75-36-700-3]|uniref:GCM domain-containing protein n=1 Tax=Puccinia graminis f. sp. tritici (strain CRL 75-36-700-3 / race SCCL) TaxID=418459 RepID=E3KBX9_PUCGT|nr:uncharacterized protein PGTG_08030 [Puccinia graminis f. sp. tritici CRL 75-36-700-3]EFP81781.2 hypothetical protein PGTG_08030 [Puccinia graminis f. sp. tritici CRL 75-36-700-3]